MNLNISITCTVPLRSEHVEFRWYLPESPLPLHHASASRPDNPACNHTRRRFVRPAWLPTSRFHSRRVLSSMPISTSGPLPPAATTRALLRPLSPSQQA